MTSVVWWLHACKSSELTICERIWVANFRTESRGVLPLEQRHLLFPPHGDANNCKTNIAGRLPLKFSAIVVCMRKIRYKSTITHYLLRNTATLFLFMFTLHQRLLISSNIKKFRIVRWHFSVLKSENHRQQTAAIIKIPVGFFCTGVVENSSYRKIIPTCSSTG